jgi:hypothetical protein
VTQLDKVFRSAMTDAGSMRGPRSVAISVARRFFVNSESEKVVLSQCDGRVAECFKALVLKIRGGSLSPSGCVSIGVDFRRCARLAVLRSAV